MTSFPWQDSCPVAECDLCGGEIYADELVHFINGFVICAECFYDYAFEYFSHCMVQGFELKELQCSYDDN